MNMLTRDNSVSSVPRMFFLSAINQPPPLPFSILQIEVNKMSSQELLRSVKPRKLEHAMMKETPLKPSHPTIKFKMTES